MQSQLLLRILGLLMASTVIGPLGLQQETFRSVKAACGWDVVMC